MSSHRSCPSTIRSSPASRCLSTASPRARSYASTISSSSSPEMRSSFWWPLRSERSSFAQSGSGYSPGVVAITSLIGRGYEMTAFNISYLSILVSNFQDDEALERERRLVDRLRPQPRPVGEFDDRVDVGQRGDEEVGPPRGTEDAAEIGQERSDHPSTV